MKSFFHFLNYHNAVPIALGVLFLGGASAFAAANPEAIYSADQTVVSVDNTYIAQKDLAAYTPQVKIIEVTEDTDAYYVAYDFSTIDVQDSVWQEVTKHNTLTVQKAALGEYGDLGLYITEQLKQNIGHEVDRLHEAQTAEQRHVTQKVVATAYGGLIGKLLDDKTEELPGYTPVVVAPAPEPEPGQTAAVAATTPTPAEAPLPQNTALTPAQIEQMIRQQVEEILAARAAPTTPQPAPEPAPESSPEPTVEPTPEPAPTPAPEAAPVPAEAI
ncbi:hypothetical protein EXS62_01185 [Candidatus Kaiserbacteria bacterium]|nr:hypothetical protein [Candidatus Kaiserbacteria bacterium]